MIVHEVYDQNGAKIDVIVGAGGTVEDGLYEIKAVISGQVLDVYGGSKDNSAKIIQWPAHNGPNQQFKVISKGGGWYKIQSKHRCVYR